MAALFIGLAVGPAAGDLPKLKAPRASLIQVLRGGKQALMLDRNTGEFQVVKVGDAVQQFRVEEIDGDQIILASPDSPERLFVLPLIVAEAAAAPGPAGSGPAALPSVVAPAARPARPASQKPAPEPAVEPAPEDDARGEAKAGSESAGGRAAGADVGSDVEAGGELAPGSGVLDPYGGAPAGPESGSDEGSSMLDPYGAPNGVELEGGRGADEGREAGRELGSGGIPSVIAPPSSRAEPQADPDPKTSPAPSGPASPRGAEPDPAGRADLDEPPGAWSGPGAGPEAGSRGRPEADSGGSSADTGAGSETGSEAGFDTGAGVEAGSEATAPEPPAATSPSGGKAGRAAKSARIAAPKSSKSTATRPPEQRRTISRRELNAALSDFSALSKQVQIELADGGGVRIVEIQGGSVFSRLGIEPGDLVLRVAGHPVDTVDRAAAAYAAIGAGRDVLVEIERAGAPLRLRYRFTR